MRVPNSLQNLNNRTLGSAIRFIEPFTRFIQKPLIKDSFIKHDPLLGSKERVYPRLNTLKSHLPAAFGAWITGFYALNILKNKEIPKERKTPLFINNIFCGGFGIVAGYYVQAAMNKFNEKFIPKFVTTLKNEGKSIDRIKELKGALSHSIMPLVAFSVTMRYLAPVVATPLATRINNSLIKHHLIKNPNKKETSIEKFNKWSEGLLKLTPDKSFSKEV